jgi:hypothetical protein
VIEDPLDENELTALRAAAAAITAQLHIAAT